MVVKMNSNGQMKIQQMAFMLLAVTLLFALIGMAFIAIKSQNLKKSFSESKEREARLLVLGLANTPEFSCGGAIRNRISGCVDADKVMALSQSDKIEKYKGFWGLSKIEIVKMYPRIDGKTVCDLSSNYPNCDIIKVLDEGNSGFSFSNFVSLCRKEKKGDEIYDKCELAKLIVWPENRK
ncbi:MAG: hypothetical protein D6707_04725 [Bacteroidetes bacterium]|nr:MAG: hypothetical protein D6707_04725 [Bacteroidota bacterium]